MNDIKEINVKIRELLLVGDVASVLKIYDDIKERNIDPNTETIILVLYAHRRLPSQKAAEFANTLLKTDFINNTTICNIVIELLFKANQKLRHIHKLMNDRKISHTERTTAFNVQASIFDISQQYLKNDINSILKQNLPISFLMREELFKELCHTGKRNHQIIQLILESQMFPEFNFVKSIAYYLSTSKNPELILHLKQYAQDWFPEEYVNELTNYLLLGYINNSIFKKAIECFDNMKKNPDSWVNRDVTFKHIFKMYAKMRDFDSFQATFNEMLEQNIQLNENVIEGLAEACVITKDEKFYDFFINIVEKYGLILNPSNYRKVREFYILCHKNPSKEVCEKLESKENKYLFDI